MKTLQLFPVSFRGSSFSILNKSIRLLAAAMLAILLASTARAHFVEGRVYCTDSPGCPATPTTPLAGIVVVAVGQNGVTASAVTAADGSYHIELPEITQSYTLTIQVQPPLVPVCPASGQLTFFLDINVNEGQVTGQNFYVRCAPAPPLGQIGDTVFCDANGNGVQDAGDAGIPGVKVTVVCTDANGNTIASGAATTDANGKYLFVNVPAGACEVTVDVTTVPPPCNIPVCPVEVTHNMGPGEIFLDADFCFTETPPPCPDCSDPALGLGMAAGCTVLQLGPGKVSITGPAGGIIGDVCMAPNTSLSMSGDEYITGTVFLGPGAKFSNSSHSSVNVVNNADLSAEISDAYAAAADAASLPCTQSYAKLDGKTITTIAGGVGINVICVGEVVLGGKQITLTGPVGAKFILNVTGKFVLTGGGAGPQIRVGGGVQPKDVLYNIIGTGADVAFSGGGGGENCCAAIVDGTLLAPYRKINLSPGLVNGQVISGKDISIVSGASVRCPCP